MVNGSFDLFIATRTTFCLKNVYKYMPYICVVHVAEKNVLKLYTYAFITFINRMPLPVISIQTWNSGSTAILDSETQIKFFSSRKKNKPWDKQ